MATDEQIKTINTFLPLGAYIPGGSPSMQNMMGFPGAIQGGLPVENNFLATQGPDPAQIEQWPWAMFQTGKPDATGPDIVGQSSTFTYPAGTGAAGQPTLIGYVLRQTAVYYIAAMLLLLGIAALLWRPAKKYVIGPTADALGAETLGEQLGGD